MSSRGARFPPPCYSRFKKFFTIPVSVSEINLRVSRFNHSHLPSDVLDKARALASLLEVFVGKAKLYLEGESLISLIGVPPEFSAPPGQPD